MRYVLVIFTTLNVIFVSSSGDIYFPASSSVCKFGEKCIPFTECETAITAWKHKKTMMKTCCFKGKIQYVCCPDSQMEPMKSDLQTNVFVKPPAIYSEVEPPKSDNLHYGNPINIDIKASTETLSDKMCLSHIRFTDSVIVGGIDAVDWEFIYMAVLRWGDYKGPSSYSCGGVLISPNFVLTAAHCTTLNGKPPNHVRIGGEKLTLPPSENDIQIKRIIVHPGYDPVTNLNDIALLELVDRKFFAVGCLWHSMTLPSNTVTAIGYGQKWFAGATSSILQKVNLTIYSNEDCEKEIASKLSKKQICAGDWLGERDTCAGDSGGPILVKMEKEEREVSYIIGITSFGGYCASGLPAVYTRVSEYREWIESIVWTDV